MAVKFNAPIDSLILHTQTNSDMVVIEIAKVHIPSSEVVELTDLIHSGEELQVKIKKASDPD